MIRPPDKFVRAALTPIRASVWISISPAWLMFALSITTLEPAEARSRPLGEITRAFARNTRPRSTSKIC